MKDYIKKNKYYIATTFFIAVLAIIFVIKFESGKTQKPTIATVSTSVATVNLTISGAVKIPGTYQIKVGSTLSDNLETFGGFLDDANIDEIKLDDPIKKDKSLTIKSKKKHGLNPDEINELYKAP